MADYNNSSFTGNSSKSGGINSINPGENSSLSHSINFITSHKLNGSNFMEWSQPPKSQPGSPRASSSTQDQISFSKDNLEQLFKLWSSHQPSSNLAHKGIHVAALKTTLENSNPWVLDSGATNHMTGSSYLFHTYYPCSGHEKVKIADGSFAAIAGKGSIILSPSMTLLNVLHVPKLAYNLISVHKLSIDSQCKLTFVPSCCDFQDLSSGTMIGSAKEYGGLYYFTSENTLSKQIQKPHCSSLFSVSYEIMLWHFRLGHPSFSYLKHLFPSMFQNKNIDLLQCEVCQLAKHKRSSFPTLKYNPSKPFALIHSDIWGPSRVKNITGTRWFITFIDDHTRNTWIYLLKDKSEAENMFKTFYKMVETQFNSRIQILRTDNGREYFNKILGEFLIEKGVIHQSSFVYTPQQNGIAERKNRHLLEVTRALMFSMNVPKCFWGDALLTAAYLINRMPSKVLSYNTPIKTLKTYFPENKCFTHLSPKIFGCTAFVHIHNHERGKLDPRAIKCIFLGFSPTQKGFKCYDPSSGKFFVSMDVTFF